jgi:hypothetical protein
MKYWTWNHGTMAHCTVLFLNLGPQARPLYVPVTKLKISQPTINDHIETSNMHGITIRPVS